VPSDLSCTLFGLSADPPTSDALVGFAVTVDPTKGFALELDTRDERGGIDLNPSTASLRPWLVDGAGESVATPKDGAARRTERRLGPRGRAPR
jgi:hypothetical protein